MSRPRRVLGDMGEGSPGRIAPRPMLLLLSTLACSTPEPLQRTELAGFSVAMPAWTEAERQADALDGRLKLEGADGFIELDWAPGAPVEEPMLAALAASGGLEVVDVVDSRADAAASRTLVVQGYGRSGAMTAWLCAGTGVGGTLSTFIGGRRRALLDLHHRVLESVACGDDPQSAAPVFPTFEPPDGYERIEHSTALLYGGPLGDVFDLSRDTPLPELPTKLQSTPGLVESMAEAELSLASVEPAGDPRRLPDARGAERAVWSFAASRSGGEAEGVRALRVIVTAWGCGPTSYVAMHAGDPTLPEDAIVAALMSAGCPD